MFHADNLSSAHVYLRLQPGMKWDDLPANIVEDCAQLTKANSIEGNKKDNVSVIYTPWSNLRKDGSMAVGQVSFHDQKKVRRILLPTRLNPIINRLNKTRTERPTSTLFEDKEEHLATLRKAAHAEAQIRKKEEARLAKERKEEKWQREHGYDDLFGEDAVREAGRSNADGEGWDEDDFM